MNISARTKVNHHAPYKNHPDSSHSWQIQMLVEHYSTYNCNQYDSGSSPKGVCYTHRDSTYGK